MESVTAAQELVAHSTPGMNPINPGTPTRAGSPLEPLGPERDQSMWDQVLARDATASFVYGVRTTGIYCRPSCGSRRPARANAAFFPDAQAAEAAGFRPCLRCQPNQAPREALLVERLAAYLDRERERSISLAELARVAGCAPTTVQRLFTRIMGLSPRAWVNARRAESYRGLLADPAARITDAVYAAGFSGPARAHGATPLGMQARRYRAQGAGERIGYILAGAPLPASGASAGIGLGRLLVAATARGVCAVLLGDDNAALTAELTRRFPRAELAPDPTLGPHLDAILAELTEHPGSLALPLDLRGTAFQARVWAALRTIPRGTTQSYAQLAEAIGAPRSVRAVANACGQNPVAIVVPCHRVVGSNGKLTGYRWGVERKRALLALERRAAEEPYPKIP